MSVLWNTARGECTQGDMLSLIIESVFCTWQIQVPIDLSWLIKTFIFCKVTLISAPSSYDEQIFYFEARNKQEDSNKKSVDTISVNW